MRYPYPWNKQYLIVAVHEGSYNLSLYFKTQYTFIVRLLLMVVETNPYFIGYSLIFVSLNFLLQKLKQGHLDYLHYSSILKQYYNKHLCLLEIYLATSKRDLIMT